MSSYHEPLDLPIAIPVEQDPEICSIQKQIPAPTKTPSRVPRNPSAIRPILPSYVAPKNSGSVPKGRALEYLDDSLKLSNESLEACPHDILIPAIRLRQFTPAVPLKARDQSPRVAQILLEHSRLEQQSPGTINSTAVKNLKSNLLEANSNFKV